LRKDQIQQAICTSFPEGNMPDNCYDHGEIDSGSEFYIVIIIVMVVLLVFLLFMIFGYKKMVRKEMSKDMNIQINNMVSQYFAIEGNKSNAV